MPLNKDFEFKKTMNKFLRIGPLGLPKKERVPHIVLDDVDVLDTFSNEDFDGCEVGDGLKPHLNCLENLHPNNNALQL